MRDFLLEIGLDVYSRKEFVGGVSDECHWRMGQSVPDLSQRRASIGNNLNPEMAMMCPCIAKWDFQPVFTAALFGYYKGNSSRALHLARNQSDSWDILRDMRISLHIPGSTEAVWSTCVEQKLAAFLIGLM